MVHDRGPHNPDFQSLPSVADASGSVIEIGALPWEKAHLNKNALVFTSVPRASMIYEQYCRFREGSLKSDKRQKPRLHTNISVLSLHWFQGYEKIKGKGMGLTLNVDVTYIYSAII